MARAAPRMRILTADGRTAEGSVAVRELLADFVGTLRSSTHRITAAWHCEDAWVAEAEATYELKDMVRLGPLPRAFVLREGADGVTSLHAYGAHELPLASYDTEHEMHLGGRWIPPL